MRRIFRLSSALLIATMSLAACSESDDVAIDLGAAFEQTAPTGGYRFTQTSAQTIENSPFLPDSAQELDPENPVTVGEVVGDSSHFVVDLALLTEALGAGVASSFEFWLTPDQIVFDTTGFAATADQLPPGSLGPLEPGIFVVDLTREDIDAADLTARLIGNGTPDLASMAETYGTTLTADEDDPTIFRGEVTFAEQTEAAGGDIDATAAGIAAGVGPAIGIDVDELTEFYISVYRAIPSEITVQVSLDDEGNPTSVESVRAVTDLSSIWSRMTEDPTFGDQLPDEFGALIAEQGGGVWDVESLIEFTPEPDLTLPAPPTPDEDRTDAIVDAFGG